MKKFGNLFKIRLKIRFRELDFVFITFALPLVIILLNSSVSSEKIEWFLPGGIVMIITISALLGCLSSIVSDKSRGILKLLHIVPGSSVIYLLCEMLITLVYTLMSISILTGASLLLGAKIKEFNILFFILTIVLGSLALMSFALIIASFINNEKIANALTSVLGTTLVVLSFPPIEIIPSTFKPFIYALPTVPLSDILHQALLGTGGISIIINFIILTSWIVIVIPIIKVFKWK